MITQTHNNQLTIKPLVAILSVLSPHVIVGSRTPRKGEKSPLPLTVFFRPQFSINAGLIRVKFIMVDCLRETLKSLARSFAGSTNLIQPTALLFVPTGGGKPSFKGITAMPQNKSPQQNTPQAQIEQHQTNPCAAKE